MKKIAIIGAAVAALAFALPASAQLRPWQDYQLSDSVSIVTMVKVAPNMIEDYLQGIRSTWVASNEAARGLGHMQSYNVYVSDLPNSGDFNVVLVARFANTSDLAPNRERYDAFMRAWGRQNEAASRQATTTVYPNLREITGEYMLREVTFMPARR
jgi:hypothetical protein